MEQLFTIVKGIIEKNRKKKWMKAASMSIACLIVFATTYSLILPAITISLDQADEEPGFEVASIQGELLSDEDADGDDGRDQTDGNDDLSGDAGDASSLFGGDEDEVIFTDGEGTAQNEITGPFKYTYTEAERTWEITVDLLDGAVLPADTHLTAKLIKADPEKEEDPYPLMDQSYRNALVEAGYEELADPVYYQLSFEKDGAELVTGETHAPARVSLRFYEEAPSKDATVATGECSRDGKEAKLQQTVLIPEKDGYTLIADVENATDVIGVANVRKLETAEETAESAEAATEGAAEETDATDETAATEEAVESVTEGAAAEAETEAEGTESVWEDAAEGTTEADTEQETESITENVNGELIIPLTYEGEDYSISLTYGADAEIPKDAYLYVSEIEKGSEEYQMYLAASGAALGNEGKANGTDGTDPRVEARFFDITIMSGDQKVEPKGAVSVDITYHEALPVSQDGEVNAVHFEDGAETATVLEATPQVEEGEVSSVSFDTDSFSVFGIVYTVDFHWNVDGKVYEFSLPGGGFASFSKLIEIIGIVEEDAGSNAEEYDSDQQEEAGTQTERPLTLDDVKVSEETKQFVEEVVSVEFSSPELLNASKIETDSTVGQIKEERGLEVQYSAELTQEQIEIINSSAVSAGDWALISLRPFTSEETLTVKMKNGEVFSIRVTDAQDDPLGLDGKAFAIVNTKNRISTAMRPVISNDRLQGDTVTLSQNGNVPTCSDNASFWVFEYVEDNKYYIKSGDLYLKITGTGNSDWKLELVEREEADPITVTENGGKYRFLNDNENGISINNYGGVFWAGNWANDDEWMMLRTPYDPNKPGTRSTVDSRALGLTIDLFDYGPDDGDYNLDTVNNVLGGDNVGTYWEQGINQYSDLKFFSYGTGYGDGTCGINNFTGSSPNHKAAQGIVQNSLNEDGYPSLQNGQSLNYLFDASERSGKTIYPNVNNLFWDENGKLRFDSDESYAYYVQGTKDFKVYNTTYDEEGSTDTETFKVGFFPFNDYDARYQCIHGDDFEWNCTGSKNTHGVTDEVGHFNHHFGLSMTGTFEIVNNQDMTFHFSGDDDLWVFVDDVLVLDIGGIHNPISGDIDFGTTDGDVSVSPNVVPIDGNNSYLAPDTIKEAFEKAGKTWDGSEGSYHEIKVFYIERGGMYSNLEMEIDLPLVPSGDLAFDKKDDSAAGVPGARFQLFTDPDCTQPLSYKSEDAYAVSDENGVVKFTGVPVGNYFMKEIYAPVGYELDSTVYEVTIKDKNYPEQGSSFIKNPNGEIVTEILNGKKQVTVTLQKEWAGGVPDGATATFALKRTRSYEGDAVKPNSTINVYRVGWNNNTWDFTNKTELALTRTYAADSTATLSWTYWSYYGSNWTRGEYYIGSTRKTDGPNVSINLPAGETVNVYLCDANLGTQWSNGVETININGENPDTASSTHIAAVDEEDTEFNNNPPTHTFPVGTTDWSYTFPAQDVEALRPDGLIETYKYYIEEVSHSPADWIVSFNPASLSESGTITATNFKNEVYVVKRWYDPDGILLVEQPTDAVSVTLSSTNGGQITGETTKSITAQQSGVWTVENNGEKLYSATENPVPEKYTVSYSFKDLSDEEERTDGGVHRGGTIYVNNTQKAGFFKVKKEVTYNNLTPTEDAKKALLAGTYTFEVYKDEQCKDPYKVNGENLQIQITIGTDGESVESETIKLPYGDYWIKEIGSTNEAMYPIGDNPKKITIDENDPEDNPDTADFTNNYDENKDPDKITIDIEKKFEGLLSPEHIPADFQVVLTYKVGNESKTITLSKNQLDVQNEAKIRWSEGEDGYTWHWHITNISPEATDFKIKEGNYDNAAGYTRIRTTLDGTEITNPGQEQNLNVTAPTATLINKTEERIEPDNDKNYKVFEQDVILVSLTGNNGEHGTLVVSQESLNSKERDAITKAVPGLKGSWKTPCYFFSIEDHPEGFYYKGCTVTFRWDESKGCYIVHVEHKQSSMEEVFLVSYDSQEALNNANYVNVYSEEPVTVDIIKKEKGSNPVKYLPGAVFTIKQLEENTTTINYKKDEHGEVISSESPATEEDGTTFFNGLTHGYYEITETTLPEGYITSEDVTIYIKVEAGRVTYLEKEEGKNPSEWGEKENSDLIEFSAAQAASEDMPASNATFTVGNTPGTALPSTGGPGTRIFTILGSILILGAGALLWRRRKLI